MRSSKTKKNVVNGLVKNGLLNADSDSASTRSETDKNNCVTTTNPDAKLITLRGINCTMKEFVQGYFEDEAPLVAARSIAIYSQKTVQRQAAFVDVLNGEVAKTNLNLEHTNTAIRTLTDRVAYLENALNKVIEDVAKLEVSQTVVQTEKKISENAKSKKVEKLLQARLNDLERDSFFIDKQ